MSHERPVEPFSDLHVEGGRVRAVLLHDPSVEGLDVAMYMDGSGSMRDEFHNPQRLVSGGGFLWDLFGWGESPEYETKDNQVEPAVRRMLQYLATKDRDGRLRVAYWACGGDGRKVELLGEYTGEQVENHRFPGPETMGTQTVLTPALKDYVGYLRQAAGRGARRGCAVIITDGQIHDAEEVKKFSAQVARDIKAGVLPMLNFVLVGVGGGIDEEQLEDICHEEYEGVGHLWCHRIAAEIKDIAELVAVLVDETMTVAGGGTVYDDQGRVLRFYEGRLPAVLEFDVAEGTTSFTLEVNGKRYTQPMPEEEHHDDDSDEQDHH